MSSRMWKKNRLTVSWSAAVSNQKSVSAAGFKSSGAG